MKLCFVTTGDVQYIATAKRALGLALPLVQCGWEVHILMEDCQENRKRVELECPIGVAVHYFRKSSALKEVRRKNDLLAMIDPDVIYICAFVVRNFVHPPQKTIRLVEHSELYSLAFSWKRWKSKIKNYIVEYCSLFYSDGLLNASLFLQETYQRRAKKLKKEIPMLYFPYAFNPTICSPSLSEKTNLCFEFTYLGSLCPEYDTPIIVQAIHKLSKSYSNIHLNLLGKGESFTELKRYIEEHQLEDFIDMPGYISETEINSYFNNTSAFLLPMNDTIQDWARCPSKLYMYLPYSKPIISCKIGEVYNTLKEKGIYYTPNNVESLYEQLCNIVEQKEEIVDYDIHEHSWPVKAAELDKWIHKTFLKSFH